MDIQIVRLGLSSLGVASVDRENATQKRQNNLNRKYGLTTMRTITIMTLPMTFYTCIT